MKLTTLAIILASFVVLAGMTGAAFGDYVTGLYPRTLTMDHNQLKDRCCWKRCRQESDMIFMGAGLCDAHWEQAGSSYKSSFEYAVDRVIPEAARAMREQNDINTKETK
jgi:hypothetical protein